MSRLQPFVKDFLPFAQKYMKFDRMPTIAYYSDQDNAAKTLGRTASYDPEKHHVALYVDDRHPKDIMRSLSHELVHHKQNCGGQFKGGMAGEQGYAQNDPHLREMEREAYELGNMCFRDWEDTRRDYLQESNYYKGESKMSLKEWKDKELNRLLMEKWGYKQKESLEEVEEEPLEEAEEDLQEEGVYNRAEEEGDLKEEEVVEEDEELEERTKRDSVDRVGGRDAGGRRVKPLEEEEDDQEAAEKEAVADNQPNPGGLKGKMKSILKLEKQELYDRIQKVVREVVVNKNS